MKVEVTNGTLEQREIDAYIARACEKYPDREIKTLGIDLDGDYVNLRYELAAEPFQRIRRITRWRYETLEQCQTGGRTGPGDPYKIISLKNDHNLS